MVTKEQFLEWKAHPVTIEVYEEIKRVRQDLVNSLAYGKTIGESADITQGLTNRLIGQISGLDQLLSLTYEDEE